MMSCSLSVVNNSVSIIPLQQIETSLQLQLKIDSQNASGNENNPSVPIQPTGKPQLNFEKKRLLLGKFKVCIFDTLVRGTNPIFLNSGAVLFEDVFDVINYGRAESNSRNSKKIQNQNYDDLGFKGQLIRVSCKDNSYFQSNKTDEQEHFCSSCLVSFIDKAYSRSCRDFFSQDADSKGAGMLFPFDDREIYVLLDEWEYFSPPKNLKGKTKKSWSFLQIVSKPKPLPEKFQKLLSYSYQCNTEYNRSLYSKPPSSLGKPENLNSEARKADIIAEIERWYYMNFFGVSNLLGTPFSPDTDLPKKPSSLEDAPTSLNLFCTGSINDKPVIQHKSTLNTYNNKPATAMFTISGTVESVSSIFTLERSKVAINQSTALDHEKFSYFILQIGKLSDFEELPEKDPEPNLSSSVHLLILGNRLSAFQPFLRTGNAVCLTNISNYTGPITHKSAYPLLCSFDILSPDSSIHSIAKNTKIYFIDCLSNCGYLPHSSVKIYHNGYLVSEKGSTVSSKDNKSLTIFNEFLAYNSNLSSYYKSQANTNVLLELKPPEPMNLFETLKAENWFMNATQNPEKPNISIYGTSLVHYQGRISRIIDFKIGLFILDDEIILFAGNSSFFNPWIPVAEDAVIQVSNVHTAIIESHRSYTWEFTQFFSNEKSEFVILHCCSKSSIFILQNIYSRSSAENRILPVLNFNHSSLDQLVTRSYNFYDSIMVIEFLLKLKAKFGNTTNFKSRDEFHLPPSNKDLFYENFTKSFLSFDRNYNSLTCKKRLLENAKISNILDHDLLCQSNKIQNFFLYFTETNNYIWEKALNHLEGYKHSSRNQDFISVEDCYAILDIPGTRNVDTHSRIFSSDEVGLAGIGISGFVSFDKCRNMFLEDDTLKIPIIILHDQNNTGLDIFARKMEKELSNLNCTNPDGDDSKTPHALDGSIYEISCDSNYKYVDIDDFRCLNGRLWYFESYFFAISGHQADTGYSYIPKYNDSKDGNNVLNINLVVKLSQANLVYETAESFSNISKPTGIELKPKIGSNLTYLVPKTILGIDKFQPSNSGEPNKSTNRRFHFLAICATLSVQKIGENNTVFGSIKDEYNCLVSLPYVPVTMDGIFRDAVYLVDMGLGIKKNIRKQTCVFFKTAPYMLRVKYIFNFGRINSLPQMVPGSWTLSLEFESFIKHLYITADNVYRNLSSRIDGLFKKMASEVICHKINLEYQDIAVISTKLQLNSKLENLPGMVDLSHFGIRSNDVLNISGILLSVSVAGSRDTDFISNEITNDKQNESYELSNILRSEKHQKANQKLNKEFFESGLQMKLVIMSQFNYKIRTVVYISSNLLQGKGMLVSGTHVRIKEVAVRSSNFGNSRMNFIETATSLFDVASYPGSLMFTKDGFAKMKQYQQLKISNTLITKNVNFSELSNGLYWSSRKLYLCDSASTAFTLGSSTVDSKKSRRHYLQLLVQIDRIFKVMVELRCAICFSAIFSPLCTCFKTNQELQQYYQKNQPVIVSSLQAFMFSTDRKNTYLVNTFDVANISSILLFDSVIWRSIIQLLIKTKQIYKFEYRADTDTIYYTFGGSLDTLAISEDDYTYKTTTGDMLLHVKELYTDLKKLVERPLIYQSRLLLDVKMSENTVVNPNDMIFMRSYMNLSLDNNSTKVLEVAPKLDRAQDDKKEGNYQENIDITLAYYRHLSTIYDSIPVPVECIEVKKIDLSKLTAYLISRLSLKQSS